MEILGVGGAWPAVELELRYLVRDAEDLHRKIRECNARPGDIELISDVWYVPVSVSSLEGHEVWMRAPGSTPIRIRRRHAFGRDHVWIQMKRPVVAGNFERCLELSLGVDDAEIASELLRSFGLHAISTLEKRRYSYMLDALCRCAIDEYSDGACICELECTTDALQSGCNLDQFEQMLLQWAEALELDSGTKLNVSSAIHMIRRSFGRSVDR